MQFFARPFCKKAVTPRSALFSCPPFLPRSALLSPSPRFYTAPPCRTPVAAPALPRRSGAGKFFARPFCKKADILPHSPRKKTPVLLLRPTFFALSDAVPRLASAPFGGSAAYRGRMHQRFSKGSPSRRMFSRLISSARKGSPPGQTSSSMAAHCPPQASSLRKMAV